LKLDKAQFHTLCLTAVTFLWQVLLVDPVVAADGHTYERSAAELWLHTQVTSPVTGALLPHTRLVPNVIIKGAIASQLKH